MNRINILFTVLLALATIIAVYLLFRGGTSVPPEAPEDTTIVSTANTYVQTYGLTFANGAELPSTFACNQENLEPNDGDSALTVLCRTFVLGLRGTEEDQPRLSLAVQKDSDAPFSARPIALELGNSLYLEGVVSESSKYNCEPDVDVLTPIKGVERNCVFTLADNSEYYFTLFFFKTKETPDSTMVLYTYSPFTQTKEMYAGAVKPAFDALIQSLRTTAEKMSLLSYLTETAWAQDGDGGDSGDTGPLGGGCHDSGSCPPGTCAYTGTVPWNPGCSAYWSGTTEIGSSITLQNSNSAYSGSITYACVANNSGWGGTFQYVNSSCTPNPPSGPLDGVCSPMGPNGNDPINGCSVGTLGANSRQPNGDYHWYCNGVNGGATSPLCTYSPTAGQGPVNGQCAPTAYNCTLGTSANGVFNGSSYTWSCVGSNGGSTASCSETPTSFWRDLSVFGSPMYTTATAGVQSTLSANIQNNGNLGTGSSFYNIIMVGIGSDCAYGLRPGPLLGSCEVTTLPATSMAPLAGAASANTTQTYTFPSEGTYYIQACADMNSSTDTGTISESDESNNCSEVREVIVGPNLSANTNLRAVSLTPSAAPYTAGTPITLTGVVNNNGTVNVLSNFSDNFTYQWGGTSGVWQSFVGNTVTKTGGLTSGANSTDVVSFTPGQSGTLYIQYCIDSTGIVAENNETTTDNCRVSSALTINPSAYDTEESSGLTVNTPWTFGASDTATKCQYRCAVGYAWNGSSCSVTGSGIDLQSINLSPSGGTFAEGIPFNISASVRNGGTLAAGSFSDDFTYQWGGTSGVWRSMSGGVISHAGGLASGATASDGPVSFTPTQIGSLYIQHCVDSERQITETNESNCSVSNVLTVTDGGGGPSVVDLKVCNWTGSARTGCADALTVSVDAPIALTWDSINADACTATAGPGFSTGGAPDGSDNSVTASSVAGSVTTYSIRCTAGGTVVASDSVTVTTSGSGAGLGPVLTVSKSTVHIGESVVVSWDTNNGNEALCTLTGGGLTSSVLTNGTGDAETGSTNVTINGRTTFTLTCSGLSDVKTVEVIPAEWET
jgi:hypothetical protein